MLHLHFEGGQGELPCEVANEIDYRLVAVGVVFTVDVVADDDLVQLFCEAKSSLLLVPDHSEGGCGPLGA